MSDESATPDPLTLKTWLVKTKQVDPEDLPRDGMTFELTHDTITPFLEALFEIADEAFGELLAQRDREFKS